MLIVMPHSCGGSVSGVLYNVGQLQGSPKSGIKSGTRSLRPHSPPPPSPPSPTPPPAATEYLDIESGRQLTLSNGNSNCEHLPKDGDGSAKPNSAAGTSRMTIAIDNIGIILLVSHAKHPAPCCQSASNEQIDVRCQYP